MRVRGILGIGIGIKVRRSPRKVLRVLLKLSQVPIFALKTCLTPIGLQLTASWVVWRQPMSLPGQHLPKESGNLTWGTVVGHGEPFPYPFPSLDVSYHPVCGPVQVKVGVKDNQTTNTQVTAIMRDVGLQNYGEFNEPFFCNEAVLWAVDENGWALLACRSV